jgi:hypothetical protein
MTQPQHTNDWIDVRDDHGRLLFKWSPRLGCMELPVRGFRAAGGARHEKGYQRVPLSVFAQVQDEQAVDTAMAVVV